MPACRLRTRSLHRACFGGGVILKGIAGGIESSVSILIAVKTGFAQILKRGAALQSP